MAARYDAVVIGAGHNGLVNAAYLARAGKKVLVLERRHVVGGAAVTEEVFPGFHFSVCSYVVSLLRPDIIRELDLPRHGLEILPLDGTFTPMPSGDYLWRMSDHAQTRREIYRHSPTDSEAYDEYAKAMVEMARFVKPILSMTPPDPLSLDMGGLRQLGGLARRFQALPHTARHSLIQLMTMSAADMLDQWFETDVLKATMSASGIIGTFLGVRSPGTAYVLLHHYMGEIDGAFRSWGFSRGGTGAISDAIAAAAREAGVEIRTEAGVASIRTKNGRANGVVLENGQEIEAAVVVSCVDPHRTFLKLLQPEALDADFRRAVAGIKMNGPCAKVNFVLSEEPALTGMPRDADPARRSLYTLVPTFEQAERSYDAARRGELPEDLWVDCVIPTNVDRSLAPAGQHILTTFVQYVPYELKGVRPGGSDPAVTGGWDANRELLGDRVLAQIERYAPNVRRAVIARDVLTPLDLERRFGLTEGNIFHGDPSLEQMFFMRPLPGWAHYRTPIHALYLCGAGTHPGGGVTGAPGHNAARVVLADAKRRLW